MTGSKSERCLALQGDTPQSDPLQEILDHKAILSLSQEKMRRAKTVPEAMPELTRIAIQEGLNLNIAKEFNEAVKEMDRRNLNLNK